MYLILKRSPVCVIGRDLVALFPDENPIIKPISLVEAQNLM
jgi:hypothetical protein